MPRRLILLQSEFKVKVLSTVNRLYLFQVLILSKVLTKRCSCVLIIVVEATNIDVAYWHTSNRNVVLWDNLNVRSATSYLPKKSICRLIYSRYIKLFLKNFLGFSCLYNCLMKFKKKLIWAFLFFYKLVVFLIIPNSH